MADRQGHPVKLTHTRYSPGKSTTTTGQVLAIIALLPVGGTLLGLSGVTLLGSLLGLAVAAPLFVICSPVLVPAVVFLGLMLTGLLSSGALGVGGLSTLYWVVDYLRSKARSALHGQFVQMGLY